MDREGRLLSPGYVYLPGSNFVAAPTSLESFQGLACKSCD